MKFYNFKTAKREKRAIIVSISIITALLIVGFVISNKFVEYQTNKYNNIIKIESSEMFQYGMNTNVGSAFIYGELSAVDAVSYPEIGGEYMYIQKIEEHYTQHERMVQFGKTTTIQTYYTWDSVNTEELKCKKINFCSIEFDSYKIALPSTFYIGTVKETSKVRYQYYGVSASYKGTVFTELKDNTISDNSRFYTNMNIDETLEYIATAQNTFLILFWMIWILLIIAIIICSCIGILWL